MTFSNLPIMLQIAALPESDHKQKAVRIARDIDTAMKFGRPIGSLQADLQETIILAKARADRISREQAADIKRK